MHLNNEKKLYGSKFSECMLKEHIFLNNKDCKNFCLYKDKKDLNVLLLSSKGEWGSRNVAVRTGRDGFPEKGGVFVSQATVPGQLKFSGWQVRILCL